MKIPAARGAVSTMTKPATGQSDKTFADVTEGAPDRFVPTDIETRKTEALALIEDPSPVRPTHQGLLSTAWESLESVTRNLVGHFLHGPLPKPVPAEEAKQLGRLDSADLINEFGESDDERLQMRLGKAVKMARAALPEAPFSKLIVLDTEQPRGSAQADGSILVSRGLMNELSDEEPLFVVGHEMGHLNEKHDAQRLAYEQRLATAKAAGPQAYFSQRMMEFYHDAEHQADDYGIKVLQHHGLGKEHAVSFHIRKMQGFQGGDPASITHPSDVDRAYRAATFE